METITAAMTFKMSLLTVENESRTLKSLINTVEALESLVQIVEKNTMGQ